MLGHFHLFNIVPTLGHHWPSKATCRWANSGPTLRQLRIWANVGPTDKKGLGQPMAHLSWANTTNWLGQRWPISAVLSGIIPFPQQNLQITYASLNWRGQCFF